MAEGDLRLTGTKRKNIVIEVDRQNIGRMLKTNSNAISDHLETECGTVLLEEYQDMVLDRQLLLPGLAPSATLLSSTATKELLLMTTS